MSLDKFRLRELKYLRWKFEDDGVIPQKDKTHIFKWYSGSLGVAFILLVILFRKVIIKYRNNALAFGIAASLISVGCGYWAETLYLYREDRIYVGWKFAMVVGLAIGIVYILLIGTIVEKRKRDSDMMPLMVVIGAVAGIICSCIVHGFLMIAYDETSLINMGAGTIFGASAGIILGRITNRILKSETAGVENGNN